MIQQIGKRIVEFLRIPFRTNLSRRQQCYIAKPLFFCHERGDVVAIDNDIRVHKYEVLTAGICRTEIVSECVSAVDRVRNEADHRKSGFELVEQIRFGFVINDYNLPLVEREFWQKSVEGRLQVSPGPIINNDD